MPHSNSSVHEADLVSFLDENSFSQIITYGMISQGDRLKNIISWVNKNTQYKGPFALNSFKNVCVACLLNEYLSNLVESNAMLSGSPWFVKFLVELVRAVIMKEVTHRN